MITPNSSSSPSNRQISVMIVEDHPLLIQGLRRVIEAEPDMLIVAEVNDGALAVSRALELEPDVILMDINLPKKNGLQATREIKTTYGFDDANIIILTAYHDEEQLFHALYAGAAAYYPKDVHPDELVPAVRQVAAGRYVIKNVSMSKMDAYRWLLKQLEQITGISEPSMDVFAPLSPREMEILSFVTRGASNKEIAYGLGISRQTVKNHISSLLRKLGVDDRTQAAVLALRRGWVRLEDTSRQPLVRADRDDDDDDSESN